MFGLNGCFKKYQESEEYVSYIFTFPQPCDSMIMRQMITTVYLSTYYVVEQMYYYKEFFDDATWHEQTLSFVIFDGGQTNSGYAIGGQIYPWFKQKLESINKNDLAELNNYVSTELNRVHNYIRQKDIYSSQVTITEKLFFIQVASSGRWLEWNRNKSADKKEEFSSHNIDYSSDQELCFAAVIAINTWLKNKYSNGFIK
ncbi:MAG: hypothetical protein AAB657_03535 [Patescibacteria group bacterium]